MRAEHYSPFSSPAVSTAAAAGLLHVVEQLLAPVHGTAKIVTHGTLMSVSNLVFSFVLES